MKTNFCIALELTSRLPFTQDELQPILDHSTAREAIGTASGAAVTVFKVIEDPAKEYAEALEINAALLSACENLADALTDDGLRWADDHLRPAIRACRAAIAQAKKARNP